MRVGGRRKMTPGRLLPLLLVMLASYCTAAESDVSSALNKDYVGKNILPDLSDIKLDSVPEPHRNAAEQFKALWDEHLTGVDDYDVVKGKFLLCHAFKLRGRIYSHGGNFPKISMTE